MARLLPLIFFLGFAVFLAISSQRATGREGDGRAWRPKSRPRRRRTAAETDMGPFPMRASELQGVRDAYSGAFLDSTRPLLRCARCQACYQLESARVLDQENSGRCASCGGTDIRAVVLVPD